MSIKNSSDTIGNRTRDHPAYSSMLQPTAPPRTPYMQRIYSYIPETNHVSRAHMVTAVLYLRLIIIIIIITLLPLLPRSFLKQLDSNSLEG